MKITQYNSRSSKKKGDCYMDSFTENEQEDEPKSLVLNVTLSLAN